MIASSTQAIVLAGVLVGLMVLAGIVGAGLDFVLGTQGWWAALGLLGLITGASIDALVLEGNQARRRPRAPRPVRTTAPRPR